MSKHRSRGGRHARPGWRIPNGVYAPETPQLKDWIPLFYEKDGIKNRELAVKDFYRIWNNSFIKEIQLRGKLVLGGELYGCHGHRNGKMFTTPYITSIKRLAHGRPCTNRFPKDVLCATTNTGETYFFNSDNFDLNMSLLLWDVENGNPLNKEKHYYVNPYFRGEEFM